MHSITGAGEYTKIKAQEKARIGLPGQPVAELTKLGWIISPDQENTVTNMLYPKTTVRDYENFCSLDVLGIEENRKKGNSVVYEEFQKELGRCPEGCYETNLLWKDNHLHLSSNKSESLGRLNNLLKNLSQNKKFESYDSVIRKQLDSKILKKVDKNADCQEKSITCIIKVLRERVQTTKVGIV